MKKITTTLLVLIAFMCATRTNAQWNLTGNANATSSSLLGTTNAVPLRLGTKNTPRLIIDTLGKVGIGTTTIPAALTVKGSGGTPAAAWVNSGTPLFTGFGEQTIGNADYILNMASSQGSARPVFIGRRSRGTLAAPTVLSNNDYLMSFLSSGYDGTDFQNGAAIDFYVDGTPTAGRVPTRISFVTGTNSGNRAERLKVGSTGDFTFNTNQLFVQKSTGNIGVGNILPQAKLDVSGNVKIADGSQGFGKILTSDSNGLASWKAPEVSPWTVVGNNISNNNSGNVGIGNSSPAAKLDIAGNIKIADGTQGAGKVLKSDANGLATWGNVTGADLISTNVPLDYSCSDTIGSVSTGIINKTTVSGNYAYTLDVYSTYTMTITDISNPAKPKVVGAIATGSNPYWVTVSGNYAYVSTASNIQVINVSNPATPVITATISTTNSPKATAVSGNFLYVTSAKKLLQVFNIGNPTSPANVGSLVTDSNTTNIEIRGNYAYIINASDNSTLQVINISNPALPAVVGSVATTLNPYNLALAGNYVYLTGYSFGKIQIFDVANPASPTLVNTILDESPSYISISGKLAFYASNNFYNGATIKALDISNPTSPLSLGVIRKYYSLGGLVSIGNLLYVGNSNYQKLEVIGLKSCGQAIGINGDGQITTIPGLWVKNDSGINNSDINANVGIGTTTPASKLDVNGSVRANGNVDVIGNIGVTGSLKLVDGTQGLSKVLSSDADGNASWSTVTEKDPKIGDLSFYSVPRWDFNNNKLIDGNIYDNGSRVGIGSVAYTYLLEVDGDASFNGVKVGLGGGQKRFNVALGEYALDNNITGSSNTAIGSYARVSTGALSNAMALGSAAIANASNKVRIGNTAVTVVESNAGSWTTSDGRFKTNVKEEVKGLEFIKLLRPVVYNFDAKKFDQHLKQNMPDSLRNSAMEGMETAMAKATAIRQTGFIAQEVEDAAQKAGYDFNGVHTPESTTDNYSISYEKMVVPLVKSVQELSKQNEELQTRLAKLEAMLSNNISKTTASTNEQNVSFADASLSQNMPNPPVNNFTRINYNIPNGAVKAEMNISDNLGRTIKQVGLNTFGKGTLNVDTKGLSSGTYNYTLFVDGKLIDTKKMVVTGK